MSDDRVARLNVVLATLERGDILMIAQEDDCRWIRDAVSKLDGPIAKRELKNSERKFRAASSSNG